MGVTHSTPPPSTFATRLARAAGDRSYQDIAISAGLPIAKIGRVARGDTRLLVEDCEQIALVLGVRAAWLAYGDGGMR